MSTDSLVTQVARLTPAGPAALATLGLIGPDSFTIVKSLFRERSPLRVGVPHYGFFGASVVDDVVLHWVRAAPTPTFEIHCHGGAAMVDGLIADLVALGAEVVTWSTFLRRAGKTQTQIEAAEALSACWAPKPTAILLDQYNGALDYVFDNCSMSPELARSALEWAWLGARLARPFVVTLFGKPNVGKSSLLNAIAGFERAIVSPTPGATRDLLTVSLTVGGWGVTLQDGAGLRDHENPLEAAGQEKLLAALDDSDLRILVVDLADPDSKADEILKQRFAPDIVLGNKSDRETRNAMPADDRVSCVTKAGLDDFLARLVARLVRKEPPIGQAVPFTDRQIDTLKACLESSR